MITKVIHSSFELDLSNIEITHVEENNWLNDEIRAKYTFPITINLTPDQIVSLKNINELNLATRTTLFDIEYYTMGEYHEALMEIKSLIGKEAEIEISYGLEEFPNFSKPLSQLPLERIELEQSIYTYAETIITQTYPDVNFNFPQVITDKFETDSEQWLYFEGIINNYESGDFLENEYDAINDEQVNRNIMQPLPYLLHILVKAFESAGYTLEGEILEDTYFKKATIYALSEFYTSFNTNQATEALSTTEYDSINVTKAYYNKAISFSEPGRYKIAGNVYLRAFGRFNEAVGRFTYAGQEIWSAGFIIQVFALQDYREDLVSVDFNIDYTGSEGDLIFDGFNLFYAIVGNEIEWDASILDLTITQLAKFDNNGNLVPTLITPDVIDLKQCVPEMNVGPFVNAFAKWHNYGIDVSGNIVTMNKLKSQIDATDDVLDLQPFEVEFPKCEFNQGKVFTLGFFDVESDEHSFHKILIDASGYQLSPFSKPDDSVDITIDALPLPLKQKNGILTAHGFLDDNSKPQVVLYDGLTNSLNLANDPSPLSIINSYLNEHKAWFDFLLNTTNFIWSFGTYFENMLSLKIKSKIYAYGQYHLIKRLTRKTLNDNTVEVEIETSSLQ